MTVWKLSTATDVETICSEHKVKENEKLMKE